MQSFMSFLTEDSTQMARPSKAAIREYKKIVAVAQKIVDMAGGGRPVEDNSPHHARGNVTYKNSDGSIVKIESGQFVAYGSDKEYDFLYTGAEAMRTNWTSVIARVNLLPYFMGPSGYTPTLYRYHITIDIKVKYNTEAERKAFVKEMKKITSHISERAGENVLTAYSGGDPQFSLFGTKLRDWGLVIKAKAKPKKVSPEEKMSIEVAKEARKLGYKAKVVKSKMGGKDDFTVTLGRYYDEEPGWAKLEMFIQKNKYKPNLAADMTGGSVETVF